MEKSNIEFNNIVRRIKNLFILNEVFPVEQDDLTKYVNCSPGIGYWLSSNDLCKFCIWIGELFNSNKKIKKCIKENELDIYWKNPPRLGHLVFLQTSSSCLETYLRKNITIAILSNHNDDAYIFMGEIKKLL
jgi:hypothetical protein